MSIELKGIRREFQTADGPLTVLDGLDMTLPAGEVTVVLGKSGCGKTTLLRIVAGLDKGYTGTVAVPEGVRTAVVFQEPRLMPWLTVRKNIAFGRPLDEGRMRELLAMTGLTGFEALKPAQLSGGMEQRTAIARALAMEPDFLLMDEPFAALDYFTRRAMQESLLDIREKSGCGALFITHSIDEALTLGDRILILRDHKIRKVYHLTGKARSEQETLHLKEDILYKLNSGDVT